jgi:hypothetical protein
VPIFVGCDGDLVICTSVARAEAGVEPPDVNRSCAWDVMGRKFRFRAINNTRVEIVDTDEPEVDVEGLKQLLLRSLTHIGEACGSEMSLRELVMLALKRTEFLGR